ncbi:hypothetical protein [Chthonobacter albigriseus]|uniref:hypothetical protein n=1 Tax=Chthonobacter albigriseus TaxID=1683161 RepID=UPI0019D589B1|nr:hypothetical protein [Chthonobacter albigriseus]
MHAMNAVDAGWQGWTIAAMLWVGTATTALADAAPAIGTCPVFPADNIWNVRIDRLPVDPRSADFVGSIGSDEPLHADFGSGSATGQPFGIPFVVVPMNQPGVPIRFAPSDGEIPIPEESDSGPYPIPPDAPTEMPAEAGSDRHVVVVQEGSCTLFELYKAAPQPDGSWNAVSAARFDLESNELRPDGWTSADAAGLPIFPGLVRHDEAVGLGDIRHALRFTAPRTRAAHVWPARHKASDDDSPLLPPMGQRFRLKADVSLDGFSPEVQVILQALKTYGMILADNGMPWFLSGAPDPRWQDERIAEEFSRIKGSDFEAVDTSSLMDNPDSGRARSP